MAGPAAQAAPLARPRRRVVRVEAQGLDGGRVDLPRGLQAARKLRTSRRENRWVRAIASDLVDLLLTAL